MRTRALTGRAASAARAQAKVSMRCILALGLVAFASAQDSCTILGLQTGIERTGVFLEFVDSEVTCNNLGGVGPDTGCPEEIRYTNIGTDFGMDPGPDDDTPVDLVVRNMTEYQVNEPIRNGRTQEQTGELGQVNLRDDWMTKFAYIFVKTGGDPDVTDDLVIFTTAYEFFYYDLDFGDAMRLRESLLLEGVMTPPGVTSINEACTDRNQPTPCLMTTVLIEDRGGGVWNCTANDRGTGADNAEFPSQILQPVADMDDFDRFAATRYVNATFPEGNSGFEVTYEVTPAASPGSSGRNFQYSVLGRGEARILYAPCYICDENDPSANQCTPCGLGVDGLSGPPCPTDDSAFPPDCDTATANACIPGNPSYPGCIESCASTCTAETTCGEEYVCFDFMCFKCGDPGCTPGTECYAGCGQGTGFDTKEACEAAGTDGIGCAKWTCSDFECAKCGEPGCDEGTQCFQGCGSGMGYPSKEACDAQPCEMYVCVPEEKVCYNCVSDEIAELGGPSFCEGKNLFKKNGFSCRLECNPPVARKDPHLYLPHGGRADFRGAHNETFAMLSAKDVAFNVLIEEADFNWAKRVVHGTKMAAAYWVVRTSSGKILKVEYNANSTDGGIIYEEAHRPLAVREGDPAVVLDDVKVWLAEKTLTVLAGGKWKLSATLAPFPFGNLAANKNKKLLDISIDALYDADHDKVAPHGIFGQAYDGDDVGVSGKIDKSRDTETTTTAQAEGAIEGTWVDYKLPSPFSTEFKYSRFDATEAKPRDVSKLSGEKTKAWASKVPVGGSDIPEF